MAFIGANRLGKLFAGMGSVSKSVYGAGKYGMDKALSSKLAMYGTMAAGYGVYRGTRNSNSSIVRGMGSIAGMGALAVAGRGAYNGMMGSSIGAATRTATSVASMGFSRMRRYATGR